MGKNKALFQDIVELAEEATLEKDYDAAWNYFNMYYPNDKEIFDSIWFNVVGQQ